MASTGEHDASSQEIPPRGPPAPTGSVAAVDEPSDLTFPDLPRLELDELLVQLVGRAQEVMSTQGRLRALLHA